MKKRKVPMGLLSSLISPGIRLAILSGITLIAVFIFIFVIVRVVRADTELPPEPQYLEGTGTHFELPNPDYLDLTLDSSVPITLTMVTGPEMITMYIEGLSEVSSTQITLSGFPPESLQHKYEDNYHNHITFTTDIDGRYTFIQDLTIPHLILIQPIHGTKFIQDDATGGDCTTIGTWDWATKTCTLSMDLFEGIQIDSSGITIDGNGHTLTGPGCQNPSNPSQCRTIIGVDVWGVYPDFITNVIVKNLNITNWYYGIQLYRTRYSIIEENTVYGNTAAIASHFSSYNVFTRNTFSNNSSGMYFWRPFENEIYNNNFIDNYKGASLNYGGANAFNLTDPIGGNYWSDFDTPAEGCDDLNSDGFCDSPYLVHRHVSGEWWDYLPWTTELGWEIPCISPHTGLDTCQLQKGDILLMHSTSPVDDVFGFIGTYWFHSGIYDGAGNILEAASPSLGVVRRPIHETGFYKYADDWVILRLTPEHQSKIDGAIEWAMGKIEDPNVRFMPVSNWLNLHNKFKDDEFYCSLFVWKAFNEQGLDLDFSTGLLELSPGPLALALLGQVLPDDIYASSYVASPPTIVVKDKGAGGFTRALVILLSPTDLRITDSFNRVTGLDPQTGTAINEIPLAHYSGLGEEPETISIPNTEGALRVEVYGTGSGSYSLGVQLIDSQTVNTTMFDWTTFPGQVDTFEISDPLSEPPQLEPVLLSVDIDIKPGSDPNCFNSNNHGVIPVAILGNSVIDASTVDPFTISLDGAGVRVKGKSGNAGSLEDVNGDGFLDLVIQIIDDGVYSTGDSAAKLTGETFDGVNIVGSDSICIRSPE